MDPPRRFAYGPRWRIIVCCFAVGVWLLVLASDHLISFAVGAGLGALPLGFAFVAALLRLAFPRFLELGEETLSVCSGFLQARVTKIPYADIEQSWEVVTGGMTVLKLRTKERTVEIVSTLLPDMTSYAAVRDFVQTRLAPQARMNAKLRKPREVGKYCFKCSYEGNGAIYDSNGEILWRVETQHFGGRPRYPYGLFRLPDFVVYGKDDKEAFRIKLERKWALAQFVMVENGLPVCTVKLRSLLRNKYTFDFVSGQHWVFRMPLFTGNFRGFSDSGQEIRVRLWSHNIWYVLIDPKADNPELVAALAFIHRERLRFN